MSNSEFLTPAERELEAALGDLAPAGGGIDRDRFLYEAGRTSARRSLHFWRAGTAAMTLALLAALAWQPRPKAAQPVVQAPEQTAPDITPVMARSTTPSPETRASLQWDENSYLVVQRRVLQLGIDALPRSQSGGKLKPLRGADYGDLLHANGDRETDGTSAHDSWLNWRL